MMLRRRRESKQAGCDETSDCVADGVFAMGGSSAACAAQDEDEEGNGFEMAMAVGTRMVMMATVKGRKRKEKEEITKGLKKKRAHKKK